MIRKKLLGGKMICHSLPLYGGRRKPLPKPAFALGVIVYSLISLSIVNTQQLQYLEYNALLSTVLYDYSHSGGPHLIGDNLLITYSFADEAQLATTSAAVTSTPPPLATDRQPHAVGVAFRHENYAVIHPLHYNQNGLYFAAFPVEQLYQNIPLNTNTIHYRLIVNGIWMHDQHNPHYTTDYRGFKISAYQLPAELQYGIYPTQRDGAVHFVFAPHYSDAAYLSNTDGQRVFVNSTKRLSVTIAGSFNGWDPYLYAMQEQSAPTISAQAQLPQQSPQVQSAPTISAQAQLPQQSPQVTQAAPQAQPQSAVTVASTTPTSNSRAASPPVFSKSLSLPPGEHYYYFVVNGTNILDPHNSDSAASIDGRIASRIVVQ